MGLDFHSNCLAVMLPDWDLLQTSVSNLLADLLPADDALVVELVDLNS